MAGEKVVVDEKVLQDKLDKGETLTKDEENFLLSEEPAVEGFKPPVPEESAVPAEKPAEEKKAEEVAAAPAAKKEVAAAPAEESEDPFVKIERELAKPEGKEDLNNFTPREKAYYYQMRRDRKARQQAEADRDAALFREAQGKKVPEKKEETAPDALEELKKKDPTDFMTVADVLKVVDSIKKPAEEPGKGKPAADPVRVAFLKYSENEARAKFPEDYDAVMELTEEILLSDEKSLIEVAKAMNAGDNPAIKSYELIKSHPDFAKLFPVAEAKIKARGQADKKPDEKKEETKPAAKSQAEIEKEKKALATEKALETNANKKKTTGNVEGGADAEDGEPSWDEISKMSDKQFAKLPKKTRQKYLERLREV